MKLSEMKKATVVNYMCSKLTVIPTRNFAKSCRKEFAMYFVFSRISDVYYFWQYVFVLNNFYKQFISVTYFFTV